jgi:hypothetical protein
MPHFTPRSDLNQEHVPVLSSAEKAWITRLEKLLLACPTPRLGLLAIGDPNLTVIDGQAMTLMDADIHDGGAESAGITLAIITSRPIIHSTTG